MTPARLTSVALILLAAAGLGACSTSKGAFLQDASENFSVAKYGPASTRVASSDSIPKGGGHYMVGEPYSIAGKTYIPREDPNYSQVGVASWYGYDFHGRETANGEIYDLDGVTAAHPTMPLPSYARVTNTENGRSITVRVNDRGPFAEGRIIDVSRTVARMLDFEDAGTAKVKVEYVGPASLDANDEKMLLASYRGPANAPVPANAAPVRVASAAPPVTSPAPRSVPAVTPAPQTAAPITVASATPVPRPTPVAVKTDAIAPVIARAGVTTAYAPPAALSPAEEAADALGRPDLKAQLALAAAKKAQELGLRGPVTP